MPKSIHSQSYLRLRQILIEERRNAGLTQDEVALRLERPQSFVSKYESGEQRLDVVEFLEVCEAIGADPAVVLTRLTG